MRHWINVIILIGTLAQTAFAAGNGPEITLIDNKISINADSISLGRLLRLFDQATGMQSKVPREFAERNLSVRFSGLSIDQAVRKIFQGQPFDYVVISGQGIIITGSSQTLSASDPQAPPLAPQVQPLEQTFVQEDPPFMPQPVQPVQPVQLMPPVGVQPLGGFAPPLGANNPFNPSQQQQQQPAVIQTPFGPIANPRANPAPSSNVAPGQTPFGVSNGSVSPFGNPNAAGQQNDLFNNPSLQNQNPQGTTNPGLFSSPTTPQRRP
ncbi:MAG: hypothetical protein DMG13_06475 [Acidobacteria bacterium]|nr:MAG: hypothetical protein DMG13_06475 [Acidobacteriota bacterium]